MVKSSSRGSTAFQAELFRLLLFPKEKWGNIPPVLIYKNFFTKLKKTLVECAPPPKTSLKRMPGEYR